MPGILDSLIEAGATVGRESQQNIVVKNGISRFSIKPS